jgi:hypothetical protein
MNRLCTSPDHEIALEVRRLVERPEFPERIFSLTFRSSDLVEGTGIRRTLRNETRIVDNLPFLSGFSKLCYLIIYEIILELIVAK